MRRIFVLLTIGFTACLPGSAFAQNAPPADAYDVAGRADFDLACAEELRQVTIATPRASTFAIWKQQFTRWEQPGASFDRIRTENRPQWIPSHYLAACAAVTYSIQRKNGVGSGKEALAQWQGLRAHFEKSYTGVAVTRPPSASVAPKTQADDPRVVGGEYRR